MPEFYGRSGPIPCMPLTPTQKSLLTWSLIATVLAALLWALAPVLAPFVVAAVMAYALAPLVNRLESGLRWPRVLAVLLVEVVFLLALTGLLLLLVPILAREIPLMRDQLPLALERLGVVVRPWLDQWGVSLKLDVASVKAFVLKYLSANAEEGVGSVLSSLKLGGSLAFALIGGAVLVPVALYYLLVDWNRLVAHVLELVPPRLRASVDSFTSEADAVLGQYLRGQLLVMLILAVYYSLGLSLFGLELAVPIGIFTGLAVFVPYLGFGVGLLLAALAGLLEFTPFKAVIMLAVVYGAGQVIEGFFLTPRLVGERIGLHPLAVIFALLAFGQLFGFVGVLVALPASAVLLVAIRRLRQRYLASGLYQG